MGVLIGASLGIAVLLKIAKHSHVHDWKLRAWTKIKYKPGANDDWVDARVTLESCTCDARRAQWGFAVEPMVMDYNYACTFFDEEKLKMQAWKLYK